MITAVGRQTRRTVGEAWYALGFLLVLLKETLVFPIRGRVGLRVLLMQVYFTGVEALAILSVIALGIGAAIIIQGVSLLPQFGQGDLVYGILILVITRELGPLLTALIVTARSGSAIATELGNMVVSHEVEAYISVGIRPISYLAVPRLIGVTVAMVLLNLYFNLFGLFGSCWIASLIHGTPMGTYLTNLALAMTLPDILASVVKSLVFGIIVAAVSIHQGFRVGRAVTEVPQRTIRSIGLTIALCIMADLVISVLSRW